MITCFICIVRSRHKDDEELAVQYSAMQRPVGQPPQLQTTSSQMQTSQLNNLLSDGQQQTINNGSQHSSYSTTGANTQQQQQLVNNAGGNHQHQQQHQQASGSTLSNPYPSSPYHQVMSSPQAASNNGQPLVNSAVIGSTEAEFQNDFIQVRAHNET